MSIPVTRPAFANNPELLTVANTGILSASLPAGVAGCAWLYPVSRPAAERAGAETDRPRCASGQGVGKADTRIQNAVGIELSLDCGHQPQ